MKQRLNTLRALIERCQIGLSILGGALITVCIIALIHLTIQIYCADKVPKFIHQFALSRLEQRSVDQSYLLLTPIVLHHNQPNTLGGSIYLTNLFGQIVHQWHITLDPFYAELEPNGKLLVLTTYDPTVDKNATHIPPQDAGGVIQELDWNSHVVWQFHNLYMHHDFSVLPNGNIATIMLHQLPAEVAQHIQGGLTFPGQQNAVPWTDDIVEIDRQGHEVWRWQSADHLDPREDAIGSIDHRDEWTHFNSIQYVAHNAIDQTEGYIISARQLSRVMIVRKKDGQIVWQSPVGMFDSQHDATQTDRGTILVFDNGTFNNRVMPTTQKFFGTRVTEVNPKTNQIVWQFINGTTPFEQMQFESPLIGGVQRLHNGNTMVVDGVRGHLFEMTENKKLVWDFQNPFFSDATNWWPNPSIFKARRYSKEDVHFPAPLPSPLPETSYWCWQPKKLW